MKSGTIKGLIAAATVALLGTGYILMSIETVTDGTVAVVYSTNGVKKEPLTAGWKFISPLEKTVEYPVRNQALETEAFSVVTSDGKKFTINVNYQYMTEATKVVDLYKNYGKQDMQEVIVLDKAETADSDEVTHEAMKSVSLNKNIQSIVKNVIQRHTLDEVYRTSTAAISQEILALISEKEAKRGFEISELNLGVANLDDATQAAMDAKVQETQNQELKTQQLETAKRDAEKIAIETEAQSAKNRIEAQAEADAVLIQATATAEANKLKMETLTPELIQAQWIAAWDGKLPTVQGEGMPIIQMPALDAKEDTKE